MSFIERFHCIWLCTTTTNISNYPSLDTLMTRCFKWQTNTHPRTIWNPSTTTFYKICTRFFKKTASTTLLREHTHFPANVLKEGPQPCTRGCFPSTWPYKYVYSNQNGVFAHMRICAHTANVLCTHMCYVHT